MGDNLERELVDLLDGILPAGPVTARDLLDALRDAGYSIVTRESILKTDAVVAGRVELEEA